MIVEHLLRLTGGARTVAEEWATLIEAIPLMPETNHIVLLEPAATQTERTALGRSTLLRALRELPGVETREFIELRLRARGGANEVAQWISSRAAEHGIQIERDVAEELSQVCGANLWMLAGELEKLAQYAADRAITTDDVHLLTPSARETSIFELIDGVIEGKLGKTLRLLHHRLHTGSDSPAGIQMMITRQLRNIIRASELIEQGEPRKAIGEATGVRGDFPLGKLIQQARTLGRPAAEQGLRSVGEFDRAVKTGQLSDELALEMLVCELARLVRSSANRVPAGTPG